MSKQHRSNSARLQFKCIQPHKTLTLTAVFLFVGSAAAARALAGCAAPSQRQRIACTTGIGPMESLESRRDFARIGRKS